MLGSSRVLVSCIAVCALAAPAGAQITQKPEARAVQGSGGPHVQAADGASYEVKFDDELLAGSGFDGTLPIIRVIPRPVRTTLIRPRTHFVPELLKSVEHI